ncbi:isoamylase early set domain-containing protein [Reinekea sp.]|jgi:1,4-alpha-glucan branching enzyme|uniref:isoamylase early set domain-containing protein n=1 Tax=Reinekea sp. TaxID=1970455 RepID=UPI00257ECD76|nr:isoamylase early set domain-containing protein [Reinekea sp.]
MAVKKKYLKSKPICKCTFSLPKAAAPNADRVTLVGDFNNWAETTLELKQLKSGEFRVDLDLPIGQQYQYRYLIDGTCWANDWAADDYVRVPEYGTDNSVLRL